MLEEDDGNMVQGDFSEYQVLHHQIRALRTALPEQQIIFFDALGRDLVAGVRRDYETLPLIGNAKPMRHSGQYGQAFGYEPTTSPRGVAIGFSHTLNRLPIYWRALETGARPTTHLSITRILNWARTKAGSINPWNIWDRIWVRGVRKQGLLSRYFIFGPRAVAVGITHRTDDIIRTRLSQFAVNWSANWDKAQAAKQKTRAPYTETGPRFEQDTFSGSRFM